MNRTFTPFYPNPKPKPLPTTREEHKASYINGMVTGLCLGLINGIGLCILIASCLGKL